MSTSPRYYVNRDLDCTASTCERSGSRISVPSSGRPELGLRPKRPSNGSNWSGNRPGNSPPASGYALPSPPPTPAEAAGGGAAAAGVAADCAASPEMEEAM
jgi:hypothetical protein